MLAPRDTVRSRVELIETLPDGSRVRRFAPSRLYPRGKRVLIHDRSVLRDKLRVEAPGKRILHRQLQEHLLERLKVKRDSLAREPAVPPEKRCV